jgi:hypothetical protein
VLRARGAEVDPLPPVRRMPSGHGIARAERHQSAARCRSGADEGGAKVLIYRLLWYSERATYTDRF